jgi:epoxyqueuosine reductase
MSTETSCVSRASLTAACAEHGLLFLGFTSLDYRQDFDRFQKWLGEKRHAELHYLENHSAVRADPRKLLEGARSAIIVGLPYFIDDKSPDPKVARYARYRDYHHVLKQKGEWVAARFFQDGQFRVTVDSAPLLERALAAQTARGFIGKNTLYIHPDHGSFLLLGEILTTQELQVDTPPEIDLARKTKEGGCGPCKLCQTACPTGALNRDYSIDASLCLSYWTIEHRGTIPEKFWPWLGDYYFGCDICQTSCPYNMKAKGAPADWPARDYPSIDKVAAMNQSEYELYFGGTPLTRAKRSGLRRNALIAMAVTGNAGLEAGLKLAEQDSDGMLVATAAQIRGFRTTLEGPASPL